MKRSTDTGNPELLDDEPRRGFFMQLAAGAIGLVLALVPLSAGSLFFLDPLLRKSRTRRGADSGGAGVQKDEDGFVNLRVSASSLPPDGIPQAFKVYDDKIDAWNKFRNVEIGTVWLRRQEDGRVVAFNTICPHLGCAVDYRASNRDFYCPCHTSTFDLKGARLNQIPPRDMDQLPVKLKDGVIWLKYQNFRAANGEKIPV
jgi:menaquinol-cytochrome c reductase iron-sulfur subunit